MITLLANLPHLLPLTAAQPHITMARDRKTVALQPPPLSVEQLRDVRDALKRPLTNRQVLVPFGSKAFFPGRLTPTTTSLVESSNGSGSGSGSGVVAATMDVDEASKLQERVVVRCLEDGTEKEVNRLQALDYLQKEIDDAAPPKRISALKTTMTQAAKQRAPNKATRTSLAKNDDPEEAAGPNVLPYFEIREELDDSGAEVRAEAINVSKHLEYLKQAAEGDNEGDAASSPAATVLPVSEKEIANEKDEFIQIPVADDTKRSLSETEYVALAARLEQLVLLEEQVESEKAGNFKSSKTLQSSGWSKGFFNKKQSKKKVAAKNTAEAAVAPPSDVAAATTLTSSEEPPRKKKSVVFGGEDQVREIPRIGERSVSTISKPAGGAGSLRPLDTSIFSGIVQEKKHSTTEAILQRATAIPADSNDDDKPRRVSRFAQRQRLLQQHADPPQLHSFEAESAVPLKTSKFAAQERPQVVRFEKGAEAVMAQAQSTETTRSAAPAKKASRFAQERQQGLR